MTLSDVKLIVLKWFSQNSGMPLDHCIFADQRGDQPDTPYGTIKITSGPIVLGHDEERQPDTGDTSSDVLISGQRRVLISMNIFSNNDQQRPGGPDVPGALQMMSNVRDSLELPTVYQALNDQGITMNDRGQVQNLSALLETTWQERSQLDVTFGYASNIGDTPGSIDQVTVGGIVQGSVDPSGIVAIDQTVIKS